VIAVALQVAEQVVEPVGSVVVGRDVGPNTDGGYPHLVQLVDEFPVAGILLVGQHDLRADQTRQIPSLGRRHQSDHRVRGSVRYGGRGDVRPAVDQRSVNLVGDDPGVVSGRDIDDRPQLVVAVGGAQRVVRVAENERSGSARERGVERVQIQHVPT
jgi:hypothetical protein